MAVHSGCDIRVARGERTARCAGRRRRRNGAIRSLVGILWPIGQGLLIDGPLTKYDQITGRAAARWEHETNAPGPQVPYWFGYCHAWCSAAVMDREPIRARTVVATDVGPIVLGIGDQKGMLTACHTQDIAQHYGIRYTGGPDEDPQDIYPDELWRVLKLYIQQQGVPIVMDVEAGPEVWNYPVYAYQVNYGLDGVGHPVHRGNVLWMCDDTVPPDFVGVKVAKETYYFSFQLQGGSLVMGSGRWIGPSVTNHPDFAWYPHIVVAVNPEVHYEVVRELVDASGSGPSGETPHASYPSGSSPEFADPSDPRIPGGCRRQQTQCLVRRPARPCSPIALTLAWAAGRHRRRLCSVRWSY